MKKVKIAIISATGSAYKRTIPGVKDSPVCEVVAIQGRNEEKLKKICSEYNIKTFYLDVQEMLNHADYDMIYIANPPFMHYDSLVQAIKTNKAIICEKPLDRDFEHATMIKKLLEGYSSPFMVAHHLRHQKAYDDIMAVISSGKVGSIAEVYCQWGFKLNVDASNASWKLDPLLGGEGTFSDNGIHVIDFMIGLFGNPAGVFGHCFSNALKNVYDNETVMLCYADKTITLNASQNMPLPGNHILFYGTKGKIECFGGIGEKSINKAIITTNDKEDILEYPQTNLYGAEVENFVKHYFLNDKNANGGTTLKDALTSLEIIDMLRKSNKEKKLFALNL
jgi:predicted dehydrogenase